MKASGSDMISCGTWSARALSCTCSTCRASEGRDPFEDWVTINQELELYNAMLAERPQIIAANKMDMPDAEDNLALFREQLQPREDETEHQIVAMSSLTKQGIQELLYKAVDLLETVPETVQIEEVQRRGGTQGVYVGQGRRRAPSRSARITKASSWRANNREIHEALI